jgi:hypothetical protein
MHAIAAFRSDKPNPEYYARLTVTKAAATLERESNQQKEGLSFGF